MPHFKCFCAQYEKQVDVVCFFAFGGVQQFNKKKTEYKPVKSVLKIIRALHVRHSRTVV